MKGAIVNRFLLLTLFASCFMGLLTERVSAANKPNIILVITDDQGYGDVAIHGNKMIKTPNLDRLYKESVRLTNFHVDPTCSPTRSALMSGMYSTRTGVWHTIMGRSLMSSDVITIAEVLKAGGYRTGMFGKWHLGDNFPCRPHDQGFDEALYNGGGGVTQTPDFFGNDYFDDTYYRNGKPEKFTGYCTDVWFREAMKFIAGGKKKDEPFFVYITTNAPHSPFLVDEKYSQPYIENGVPGSMAKFYGMITNIDENMGVLMKTLKESKLEENTILIFMTDNGTAAGVVRRKRDGWNGFNDGMRGQKGSEYDGGHRVPFFIRWPAGGIGGGRDVGQLTAHVDVLPTLADLSGVKNIAKKGDGISLAPLLKQGDDSLAWPNRTLIVHSQRIENPEKWRKCSVMTDRWRLVNGKQLFDMHADPGQTRDVADQNMETINELRSEYEKWWTSLSTVFDDFVRIGLGSKAENPANITCHDWHTGNKPVPWNHGHIRRGPMNNGFWAVDVLQAGDYVVTLRRWPKQLDKAIEAVTARLKIGAIDDSFVLDEGATRAVFKVRLKKGQSRMQTWLKNGEGQTRGAYYVEVRRVAN